MPNATNKTSTLFLALALFVLSACTPQAQAAQPTGTAAPNVTRTATAHPSSTSTNSPTPQAHPTACTVSNTQGESLNIRRAPSLAAEITAGLLPGETVKITGQRGAWYEITGKHPGFISKDFCK